MGFLPRMEDTTRHVDTRSSISIIVCLKARSCLICCTLPKLTSPKTSKTRAGRRSVSSVRERKRGKTKERKTWGEVMSFQPRMEDAVGQVDSRSEDED